MAASQLRMKLKRNMSSLSSCNEEVHLRHFSILLFDSQIFRYILPVAARKFTFCIMKELCVYLYFSCMICECCEASLSCKVIVVN